MQTYRSFPKTKDCQFCLPETLQKAIRTTKYAYIVANRVSYDLWDNHEVTEHLMVLPKRHVHSLSDLTPEERLDIMNIMAEYEAQNYSVYARGIDSPQRSQRHQHTHLIKSSNKPIRASFYLRRPYFLISV